MGDLYSDVLLCQLNWREDPRVLHGEPVGLMLSQAPWVPHPWVPFIHLAGHLLKTLPSPHNTLTSVVNVRELCPVGQMHQKQQMHQELLLVLDCAQTFLPLLFSETESEYVGLLSVSNNVEQEPRKAHEQAVYVTCSMS